MIRTTMTTLLAVGFFTATGLSAIAAPKAGHHQAKAAVVAQAEPTAPATDDAKSAPKADKKDKKKADKKDKKIKATNTKDQGAATDGTSAAAPGSDKMPEKK